MDLIQIVIFAIVVVAILSIVYRLIPHRKISTQKPQFALFPKYVVRNLNDDQTRNTLEELGFKRQDRSGVYVRGHFRGDFSASLARLNVVVDPVNVYVHSPLIVILFDTGDLWEIASAISEDMTSE